jgi:hypothetical protein
MATAKKAQAEETNEATPEVGYDENAEDNTYAVTVQSDKQIGEDGVYEVMESRLEGQEWGPYADYRIVDTAIGQFGVPAHTIMTMAWKPKWNPKTGETREVPDPQYRKVPTNDPRTKPHTELTQEEIKRIAEHRRARAKRTIA